MRVFARISWRLYRFKRQKLYPWVRSISVANLTLGLESLIYGLLLIFILTGKRGRYLENLGVHADVLLCLLLLAGFALLHTFVRQRLVPRIEGHFFPKPYEEKRIYSGLGQEVRTASSIDQLYQAIVCRIAQSFESNNVAILVRDEHSGDYICVASSSPLAGELYAVKPNLKQTDNRVKLARNAFVVKRLNGLSTPLVIEASEIETWSRAFSVAPAYLRDARAFEQASLRLLKSHLLVQVKIKDQMVGILSLGLRRSQFTYRIPERETLMSVAGQLALVIENSRLAERMIIQDRMNRELLLAAEVQRRLLPARAPKCQTAEVAGFCEPARGVGGDFYDFIGVGKHNLGIAIADVAGKGMPAALLMSTVQATLRSLTTSNGNGHAAEASLAQTVDKLNRLIFNSTDGQHYVTFFFAHFDQITRCLTYVNAGHNPPLYLKGDDRKVFQRLTTGGLITGVFDDCKYDQETLQMQPDDLLFLYTDGLTEAMNREGEEFGEQRVEQVLAECASLPAHDIRDQMVSRVKEWCKGTPLYDDLTFVVMKVS